MSKNEQKGNEKNETYILPSYIDTNQAHESLFQWIEKQNSETFVRDNFFVNKMIKKYYGCIAYWFKNKSLNPSHIIIVVPGSNKVPEAITAISKYYNYNKFDESEKEKTYTEITISDEEADPIAYELLKKQYPALFDEVGNLMSNTDLLGTFFVAIPVWEGTYNSKYGREHRFYIDAQTGEVTGDLYSEKSKINKKNSKRLTPKDLEKLDTPADKNDKNVDKVSTTKTEKVESTQNKREEKKKDEIDSSSQKKSISKTNDDENEDKEIEDDERKRYIVIALIVVCIAILLFITSKILTPNRPDPKTPNPHQTSITATPKPKYTPPAKDKVDKTKIEKETPEKFADSIIKKLISQKYKDINELMSKNPDEMMEIEGYTNVTSTFENLGELEGYYSKTTSIFPEKTTNIFKSDSEKISDSDKALENKLPDDSAIPDVVKEQAKEDNNLISVSTSYIETYSETAFDGTVSEKKDRTILIFTLSSEDNKTKIKSVHRKYEQVDESAISQILEKESNSYSEISQNKPEDDKKEEKIKQEEKKNSENSYKKPEKEVEYSTTQKPHINLIPQGSTYVEDVEPPKKQEQTKKESVEQVETSATQSATNSSTTNPTTSLSEGSDSGSAGGSVQ